MALQMQKTQPLDAVFGQDRAEKIQIAQGHWRQGRCVLCKIVKISITTAGMHNCPVISVEIILYNLVLVHFMRHGVPFG